jgi:transposase
VECSIQGWHRRNEASQRLETIPGISVITATAIAAFATDIGVFQSAR